MPTLDSGITSTPSLTENHQTLSDPEKSTPSVGEASVHTDNHTSPQPLVSGDQPCGEEREGEEREGEKGELDDGVNSLEKTNKDV